MKQKAFTFRVVALTLFLCLCVSCSGQPAGTSAATEEAVVSVLPSPSPLPLPSAAAVSSAESIQIYAPSSTSAIPILLAACDHPEYQVTLYSNPEQANALFIRGEIPLMVSGLSVGFELYKHEVPVQILNSYVSGLSYLVTYGKSVDSYADLKGQSLYLPFEGSPLEEVSRFFAQEAGLVWKTDIQPVYSPFTSSVELLKQGKIQAVILPEPNVSLIENNPDLHISISYYDEWNRLTGSDHGYPQVGTLINAEWAKAHPEAAQQFNHALEAAIQSLKADPQAALQKVQDSFKLPPAVLSAALGRTRYHLVTGQEMQQEINDYYHTIGAPLDESVTAFFYIPVP